MNNHAGVSIPSVYSLDLARMKEDLQTSVWSENASVNERSLIITGFHHCRLLKLRSIASTNCSAIVQPSYFLPVPPARAFVHGETRQKIVSSRSTGRNGDLSSSLSNDLINWITIRVVSLEMLAVMRKARPATRLPPLTETRANAVVHALSPSLRFIYLRQGPLLFMIR